MSLLSEDAIIHEAIYNEEQEAISEVGNKEQNIVSNNKKNIRREKNAVPVP
jgi:hypothetical protein